MFIEMNCTHPTRDLIRLLQVRYHHDGKYNVMGLDGPIEIHGKSREDFRFSRLAIPGFRPS